MLVAIYARSANDEDLIIQVENCMRYIADKWKPCTQIKIFTEVVAGLHDLRNCVELQKLINESDVFNAVVVSDPLCFFPHSIDEFIAIYRIIGGRKIHYAANSSCP